MEEVDDGTRGSARHQASKKRKQEGEDDTRETALQIMRTLKERVPPFVFFYSFVANAANNLLANSGDKSGNFSASGWSSGTGSAFCRR